MYIHTSNFITVIFALDTKCCLCNPSLSMSLKFLIINSQNAIEVDAKKGLWWNFLSMPENILWMVTWDSELNYNTKCRV